MSTSKGRMLGRTGWLGWVPPCCGSQVTKRRKRAQEKREWRRAEGALGALRAGGSMNPRTFDMGDPEPEDVQQLVDYRVDDYEPDCPEGWSPYWSRTEHHGWKGYTDGGKSYIRWDELVRRYGPLSEMEEA